MSCNYHQTIYCETIPSCVEKKCVLTTLKQIDRLQRQSLSKEKQDSCLRCHQPFLGQRATANTRPIILYLKNGQPFNLSYCNDAMIDCRMIFRVEEVRGNCSILRLLIPLKSDCHHMNRPSSSNQTYQVTKTCVTVDLNEFSAVQCLDDVELSLKGCLY